VSKSDDSSKPGGEKGKERGKKRSDPEKGGEKKPRVLPGALLGEVIEREEPTTADRCPEGRSREGLEPTGERRGKSELTYLSQGKKKRRSSGSRCCRRRGEEEGSEVSVWGKGGKKVRKKSASKDWRI